MIYSIIALMRSPKTFTDVPTLATTGWALLSAEGRHAAAPSTFEIPTLQERENLSAGDAAQLLFDIETKDGNRTVDRGVDKMWVIVKQTNECYWGVLDNDPGVAANLDLRRGDMIPFRASHVCSIGKPPREYVLATYGADFFD